MENTGGRLPVQGEPVANVSSFAVPAAPVVDADGIEYEEWMN